MKNRRDYETFIVKFSKINYNFVDLLREVDTTTLVENVWKLFPLNKRIPRETPKFRK